MNVGYIKLHRKLLDWEWFKDVNTSHLFLYILCKANWEEETWRGHTIPRGSFITSLRHLSQETGLTEREIRTCLNHLKSTHEIAYKSTNKFTQIYVIKWEDYQCYEELTDTQNDTQHVNRATSNRQQYKNIKNIKNIRNIYRHTERLPEYDDSNNPIVDEDSLNELLKERNVPQV